MSNRFNTVTHPSGDVWAYLWAEDDFGKVTLVFEDSEVFEEVDLFYPYDAATDTFAVEDRYCPEFLRRELRAQGYLDCEIIDDATVME